MIRRSARNASSFNSCSHSLSTDHPSARSLRATRTSRRRLAPILASQNRRFVRGIERQRRQPCQKHPSTKTARRLSGKTKSGRPDSAGLDPIVQPRTPKRTSNARSRSSVLLVPLPLLRLMTRERVARSNRSTIRGDQALAGTCDPLSYKATACRLINSGGSAFPMSSATA